MFYHPRFRMTKDRVKTGVPGLDEMLEGGLIPGRPYIISGTSGTGKTTMAFQFLLEGAKNDQRVLYVALDEPPNEVKRNMESLGFDLSGVHVFDATPDVMNYEKTPVRDVSTERKPVQLKDVPGRIRKSPERNPADISINTLQETLKHEMSVGRYSRVVIDSLTSLRYFYIRTSEEEAALQSFLRVLADTKVTSILTVQLPEVSTPSTESHLARGEVRLHKWFNGRGLMRGVTVEKCRGSSHDHRLRPMKTTSSGIVVTVQTTPRRSTPQTSPKDARGENPVSSAVADNPPIPTDGPPTPTIPTSRAPSAEPDLPPPPPDEHPGGDGI